MQLLLLFILFLVIIGEVPLIDFSVPFALLSAAKVLMRGKIKKKKAFCPNLQTFFLFSG